MKTLFPIIRMILAAAPQAMMRGAVLSVLVLLMGAALLGLSGWFITATGLAGIAGLGIAFDVFRPSAGVRFLALGRTAARYGERVFTHDATLRALAFLRVRLLRRQVWLDSRALSRLRSEAVLTRIIADVDALDGVVLRLLLPAVAALATHLIVFLAIGWLAGWTIAWALLAGYIPLAVLIFWQLARRSIKPSDRAEKESQTLRRGVIDMIRNRQSLILDARLDDREADLLSLDGKIRKAAQQLDRAERGAALAITMLVTLVAAFALGLGGWLVAQGVMGPAVGVIGIFVALALAETLMPLRRGIADYGKMAGAAKRIGYGEKADPEKPKPTPPLCHENAGASPPVLAVRKAPLTFMIEPGEAIALTGASGSGKTSLLMEIAGLAESSGIAIFGRAPADWPDSSLRDLVTMVPQRSVLLAGTIRENFNLAADVPESALWQALAAISLDAVIRERGGLDAPLGEAGAGLSGGQAQRLALARAS
ncbi:ABC transporter ATP-binding protein [Iodidimonas gelatinilytica]|uniref:ABC transporter ATP-binding protein n=1 Tax=Iodidimonas gelatinilytica TaxID=1236966 RepID=A0A5A7N158_9PROT|nr:ATP-binding cassette domain-containing protein [Iodidimonas gelatinilytica]GER01757.1 ABC transporter ATP-binding protein [Iodidimonas gelatinilytica]